MTFFRDDYNIALEGTMSQIFYLGSSFYFIEKNRKLLLYF